MVATNLVTWLRPEDYLLRRTLVDIQVSHHHRGVTPLPYDQFYLASAPEMATRIPCPRGIANTTYIASLCRDFPFPVGKAHPPRIHEPAESTRILTDLCMRQAAKMLRPASADHIRRLDRELQAIRTSG